ncbi:MAG: hypothetical protein AAF667_05055 [Pseudomonadota bacterium]
MKNVLALLPILTIAGTAAFAADLDADGDGMVTYEEILAAYPEVSEETFTTADADGDGMLSASEVAAAADAGLIPAQG